MRFTMPGYLTLCKETAVCHPSRSQHATIPCLAGLMLKWVCVYCTDERYHKTFCTILARHSCVRAYLIDLLLSAPLPLIPHPSTLLAKVDSAAENFTGFAISTNTVFGYSFLVASFVLFLVQEKESKVWCMCEYVCCSMLICLHYQSVWFSEASGCNSSGCGN